MTFLLGAGLGALGNTLYQLADLRIYVNENGFFPWQNAARTVTASAYAYSFATKLFIAFVIVGALTSDGDVGGKVGTIIAGAVGEDLFLNLADKARRSIK